MSFLSFPPSSRFRSAIVLGAAALSLVLAPGSVRAQGFTPDDTQLRFDGVSVSPLSGTARAGFTGTPTPGGGIVPIFVYRLPTLAAGTTITNAVLSLNLASVTSPNGVNYNVDLYGLGFRATPTITATDFYTGPLDATGNAVRLQDDFVLRSSVVSPTTAARYESNAAGSSAIASFLNAQYAAGAVGGAAGSFVFFRLSPDATYNSGVTSFGGYDFSTQDNASTSGLRPTLTLTTAAVGVTAPEAGSGLLLMSVLLPLAGTVLRRRSRR